MTVPAILAIDQGTTNSKAFLYAPDGRVLARASRSMAVSYPQPGWAELDGLEIWATVKDTIDEVLAAVPDVDVKSIGITNQRESILLWDAATGKPVGPCIIWQCRRSSAVCQTLRDQGLDSFIAARSGLGIDPLFPAAKLAWLLDSQPDLRGRASELKAGTVDAWILWNLTGGQVHATDASNASRTQLISLQTQAWDPELLKLFNIPADILPIILPSNARFGHTDPGVTGLAPIPVNAIMGDSHSALYGHGIRAAGQVKVTLGTGSSLMALTPERIHSQHGLSSTIAWKSDTAAAFAIEGNISVSGQTAAFTVDLLNLRDEAELTELARATPDAAGVVFVPALAGLGAPHWKDTARGQISGMTLGTHPGHIARASLNAICLQILEVLQAMELDLGMRLPEIVVDGGAAANDFLMSLLADILDRPVRRPRNADVTALGVARMAGEGAGIWQDQAPAGQDRVFVPAMEAVAREKLIAQWRRAIASL